MATSFVTVNGKATINKDVQARLDYTLDWAEWLDTDTIEGIPVWTATNGITIDSYSNTDTTTTVWLSGGTVNTTYDVHCKISTAAGRVERNSFKVRIVDR